MRSRVLEKLVGSNNFKSIDLNIPFNNSSRVSKSLAFRFRIGPVVKATNNFILSHEIDYFDIIWIDKAVLLTKEVILSLGNKCKKLVHFTPDMAFFSNKSKFFEKNINYFDYLITSKSIEIDIYKKIVGLDKVIVTTQGYSKSIHKSYHCFEEKSKSVTFIGLGEKSRYDLVQYLIDNDITVNLVGKKWTSFVSKNKKNIYLNFLGIGVFGEDYARLISSSLFSIGLLSKKFQELHTTRTFEIPACGTALITERNAEIESFYSDGDVIFYNSKEEIVGKIKYYLSNLSELETLTVNGSKKVEKGGYDYETLMLGLLKKINA